MGFDSGLFHWLSHGWLALGVKRTFENHQGQVSDLLDLNQFPAIVTDVVKEAGDLRSAVALAVVLGELTAECFSAQGTAKFAAGIIRIGWGLGHHLYNLVFPNELVLIPTPLPWLLKLVEQPFYQLHQPRPSELLLSLMDPLVRWRLT